MTLSGILHFDDDDNDNDPLCSDGDDSGDDEEEERRPYLEYFTADSCQRGHVEEYQIPWWVKNKKRGLGDGIGLKKSCHHLGTYLYLYLFIFLRKKMKSVKKVTKLPALTVQG